jgi:hypothetical protein
VEGVVFSPQLIENLTPHSPIQAYFLLIRIFAMEISKQESIIDFQQWGRMVGRFYKNK